jgi:hypothetical protein
MTPGAPTKTPTPGSTPTAGPSFVFANGGFERFQVGRSTAAP